MKMLGFALFLVLAGCASKPLYSPAKSSESIGYFETQLTDNRYRVIFNGGINTPIDQVKNYALLRSAELTIEQGYSWFQIVERENSGVASDRNSPKVSVSVGVGAGGVPRCYPYGCRVVGGPAYSGIGLQTTDYRDTRQSVIEIFMGKGEPEEPTAVYDANELIKYLRTDK